MKPAPPVIRTVAGLAAEGADMGERQERQGTSLDALRSGFFRKVRSLPQRESVGNLDQPFVEAQVGRRLLAHRREGLGPCQPAFNQSLAQGPVALQAAHLPG